MEIGVAVVVVTTVALPSSVSSVSSVVHSLLLLV